MDNNKPMTRADAFAEARRRWGIDVFVIRRRSYRHKCEVGKLPLVSPCYGYGGTWEDAFADADKRAAEK